MAHEHVVKDRTAIKAKLPVENYWLVPEIETSHFQKLFAYLESLKDVQLRFEYYRYCAEVYHFRLHEEEDEQENSIELFLTSETVLRINNDVVEVHYDGVITSLRHIETMCLDSIRIDKTFAHLVIDGAELVLYHW